MSTSQFKKNILVIDDQKSIRFLLGTMLGKNYNIIAKRDGIEGMAWMARGNRPDLILLDMQMPRLKGDDFLRNIKTSGLFGNVPVIVLSGNENSSDIDTCFKLGADEYIKKPFNPIQLQDKIDSIFHDVNLAVN